MEFSENFLMPVISLYFHVLAKIKMFLFGGVRKIVNYCLNFTIFVLVWFFSLFIFMNKQLKNHTKTKKIVS